VYSVFVVIILVYLFKFLTTKDCRMKDPHREPQQNNNNHRHEPQKMTWIRKKDQYSNEECTLSLQAKKNKHGWYVDSGCSKHMIGDRDRFLTL
jgi:hypothetical protein